VQTSAHPSLKKVGPYAATQSNDDARVDIFETGARFFADLSQRRL
jgi:hypothetical protein